MNDKISPRTTTTIVIVVMLGAYAAMAVPISRQSNLLLAVITGVYAVIIGLLIAKVRRPTK